RSPEARRPGRRVGPLARVRDGARLAGVGEHVVELARSAARRGEDDLPAVGRPARVLVLTLVLGEPGDLRRVLGVDEEEVELRALVAGREDDLAAPRRPVRLLVVGPREG